MVDGNQVRKESIEIELSVDRMYEVVVASRELVTSKQLLKSGTCIGASIEETTAAESRREFLHKMTIGAKEARETLYWLRFLKHGRLSDDWSFPGEISTAEGVVRMLTALHENQVETTRQRQQMTDRFTPKFPMLN